MSRSLKIIFISLLMTATAHATCYTPVLSCFQEEHTPPTQFDFEPTIPYQIEFKNSVDLQEVCWALPGEWVWGCVRHGVIEKIYVDDSLSSKTRDIIIRHEKAHVNGWRHHE